MKKILKQIALLIGIVILLFRLIMIYTTKDLFDYVRKVMMNQIPNEETLGKPINVYQNTSNIKIDTAKVKIVKLGIWHNFKRGVIHVRYEFYQYSNDKIVFGASSYTTWEIEKRNDKWEIVKIIETP